MIKDADPISDTRLNDYINTLEERKSNKSKELIKINTEFREIDQKLKDALEVREIRLLNKMAGGGK
ncbi:hypothetical protein [Sebaldella sp. S0638]|uniref:hypothetical protein n=1 Tax=Sebaldella sp. S0638 TaxID=2957809 RepID=UPI00209FDB57|nr:hypothetical protein [Sebaldella sp. S0638]MCP1226520.1 hypothetical protein [Sebaldella sp. S0638]